MGGVSVCISFPARRWASRRRRCPTPELHDSLKKKKRPTQRSVEVCPGVQTPRFLRAVLPGREAEEQRGVRLREEVLLDGVLQTQEVTWNHARLPHLSLPLYRTHHGFTLNLKHKHKYKNVLLLLTGTELNGLIASDGKSWDKKCQRMFYVFNTKLVLNIFGWLRKVLLIRSWTSISCNVQKS